MSELKGEQPTKAEEDMYVRLNGGNRESAFSQWFSVSADIAHPLTMYLIVDYVTRKANGKRRDNLLRHI